MENIKFKSEDFIRIVNKSLRTVADDVTYDDDNGISTDVLNKIQTMWLTLPFDEMDEVRRMEVFQDLATYMQFSNELEGFHVVATDAKIGEPTQMDLSFVNSINPNVQFISFDGIDLSRCESSMFDKFNNLIGITLQNNQIPFDVVRNIQLVDSEYKFVQLMGNPILQSECGEVVEYMKSSGIEVTVREVLNPETRESDAANSLFFDLASRICKDGATITLSEFAKRRDEIERISPTKGITILLDEKATEMDARDIDKVCELAREIPGTILHATDKNEYIEFMKTKHADIPTCLLIHSVSDLRVGQLESIPNVSEVFISEGGRDSKDFIDGTTYSREKYLAIVDRLEEITAEARNIPLDTPDREKIGFASIYKNLLSNMEYDHYAISEEGKLDKVRGDEARGIDGCLLNGMGICLGISRAIKSAAEYFGAEAHEIGGAPKNRTELMEKGLDYSGHSWNVVKLDGVYFNVDGTWDMDRVKRGRYPLTHFLKSDKDFIGHNEFDAKMDDASPKPECGASVTTAKQVELMTGKNINRMQEAALNFADRNYMDRLGDFVSHRISRDNAMPNPNSQPLISRMQAIQKDMLARIQNKNIGQGVSPDEVASTMPNVGGESYGPEI